MTTEILDYVLWVKCKFHILQIGPKCCDANKISVCLTQLSLCLYLHFTDAGFEFDLCYTSVLKRAIRTLWLVLDGIDQMWVPVHRTWRLNERHYGGLTGLNKAETAAKHGEAQVKIWRRSFDIPPPPMGPDHDYYTIISKVWYDCLQCKYTDNQLCWHSDFVHVDWLSACTL